MIAPLATTGEPPLRPPELVAPAPYQTSFGRVEGRAAAGAHRVLVQVDGRTSAAGRPRRGRFRFTVALPRRDVTIRVVAVDRRGRRGSTSVAHVFGLPRAAAPRPVRSVEDPVLARRVRALAHGYVGIAGVYVQDVETGAGAAWNARARFPAASTLKLAIAVEVMRALPRLPPHGSRLDRLLWRMLVHSDNEAANSLEIWLGGSTSGGAARVNATMRALGMSDSEMYGGYELGAAAARPIPIRVEAQPAYGAGKRTTASDLARLARLVHLAAGGRGPLLRRVRGFSPEDARFLLYKLAHSADRGKLDRGLRGGGIAVLHKAGWIDTARHDAGVVYWPGGAFVVAVMTWRGSGVGESSDRLAGRVAAAALERFRVLRRRPAATVDVARAV